MTGVTTLQQNPKILLTIPMVIKMKEGIDGTTVVPGMGHNVGTETGQNPKSEVGNGVGLEWDTVVHMMLQRISKQKVHVKTNQ